MRCKSYSQGVGKQDCSSTFDPEGWRNVSTLKIDLHDVRVTTYTTGSVGVVVHGAAIRVRQGSGTLGDGLEVHDWHEIVEFHDVRLHQVLLFFVPLGSFENKSSYVSSVLGVLADVIHGPRDDSEIELKSINRDDVSSERLAGEALEEGGIESVRVSEGVNAEHVGETLSAPAAEELHSFVEIIEPARKRLEREVVTSPLSGHLVIKHRGLNVLKIGSNDRKTLDTTVKHIQIEFHNSK